MLARVVFVLTCVAAAPALAHHGFGTFELNKTVSFPGALITRVEFINPHSWLYFETKDANGRVQKHRCEMRSAHVLRRSGWEQEMFKAGQTADITASPDRADPASCYLQTILFANGTRMDRYGQYVKAPGGGVKEVAGPVRTANTNRPATRPTGEPNISGEWAPEQVVMADPRGVGGGLIPLSQVEEARQAAAKGEAARGGGGGRRGGGAGTGPRLYGGTELTERGAKEAEAFTQKDNPRFQCQTTSIIFDWTFDGPVNRITQNRDNIVIEYGQMNLRRTVHMNQKAAPANAKPSRAGYSVGRWEGNTLVVETTKFLPGVLNAPVRHSDQLRVVERFTLDPKTMRLTREYQATDPVYLKGTYSGRDVVQPADAPYAKDNCKELKDVDYSKTAQ